MKTNFLKKTYMVILTIFVFCFSVSAEIKTEKHGKTLIVKFYTDGYNQVTEERFQNDFTNAMQVAINQKCTAVAFKDNTGGWYKIIKGKKELQFIKTHLDKVMLEIEKMQITETKRTQKPSKRPISTGKAKYRVDTYINGILESTYETDWEGDYFEPSTSTYTSGQYKCVTKTYYVPKETIYIDVMVPIYETMVITKGITAFAEKVYFIK